MQGVLTRESTNREFVYEGYNLRRLLRACLERLEAGHLVSPSCIGCEPKYVKRELLKLSTTGFALILYLLMDVSIDSCNSGHPVPQGPCSEDEVRETPRMLSELSLVYSQVETAKLAPSILDSARGYSKQQSFNSQTISESNSASVRVHERS